MYGASASVWLLVKAIDVLMGDLMWLCVMQPAIQHHTCALPLDSLPSLLLPPMQASGCTNGYCNSPGECICYSGWSGSTCTTAIVRNAPMPCDRSFNSRGWTRSKPYTWPQHHSSWPYL